MKYTETTRMKQLQDSIWSKVHEPGGRPASAFGTAPLCKSERVAFGFPQARAFDSLGSILVCFLREETPQRGPTKRQTTSKVDCSSPSLHDNKAGWDTCSKHRNKSTGQHDTVVAYTCRAQRLVSSTYTNSMLSWRKCGFPQPIF